VTTCKHCVSQSERTLVNLSSHIICSMPKHWPIRWRRKANQPIRQQRCLIHWSNLIHYDLISNCKPIFHLHSFKYCTTNANELGVFYICLLKCQKSESLKYFLLEKSSKSSKTDLSEQLCKFENLAVYFSCFKDLEYRKKLDAATNTDDIGRSCDIKSKLFAKFCGTYAPQLTTNKNFATE